MRVLTRLRVGKSEEGRGRDGDGGVDRSRHHEGVGEEAREEAPVVDELDRVADGPEGDAGLFQIHEETRRAHRQVEVVDHVHEDDRVRLAPGNRLPADAREEPSLGEIEVQLVDAVALAEDVSRILVLVVEPEAFARDVVARRLPGPGHRPERFAPLGSEVVEHAVVEAPPCEAELEVIRRQQREAWHAPGPLDVVGQLGVELGVVEVPVREEVAGAEGGWRLAGGFRGDRNLGIDAGSQVEVVPLVEEVRLGRRRHPEGEQQGEGTSSATRPGCLLHRVGCRRCDFHRCPPSASPDLAEPAAAYRIRSGPSTIPASQIAM